MTRSFRAGALGLLVLACGGNRVHEIRVAGPYAHHGLRAPAVRPETPDDGFRKTAPATDAGAPFVPPQIHEARLKNGIRVLWVERHELPLVALRLVSEVGADQVPPSTSELMLRTMFKGTKEKSRKEISRSFNYMGVWPELTAHDDSTEVLFRMLNYQVDKLSEVVSEVLRDATYPPIEVEDARSKMEIVLARQLEDPETAVSNTAYDLLYPDGHPYKLPPTGNRATLKAVAAAQLPKLHAWAFDTSHLTIAVAGDVDGKMLIPTLEKHFGGLTGKNNAAVVMPTKPAAPAKLRLVVVDRAGDTQASVWVAGIGAARSEEGFYARLVLAAYLSDELFRILREVKGWTYGARCAFDVLRGPGAFHAGGAIDTVHAAEAIREIRDLFTRAIAAAPTEEALARAKDSVRHGLPLRFETVAKTTETLAALAIHHLPLDTHATMNARISAVTAAEVLAAAKTYLHPDQMQVAIVGDAAKLKAQLEALALGPIEVRAGPAASSKEGAKHEH